MSQPNLLLVITDCLRSDYLLGETGNSNMPFIDSLRQEGVTFSNMITSMSITTPNFTSIMTGRYPVEHGLRFLSGNMALDSEALLMNHFNDQGYTSYGLFTGPLFEDSVSFNDSFDYYEYRNRKDYLDNDWGQKFLTRIQQKTFQEPWFIVLHLWELHQPRRVLAAPATSKGTPYEKALTSLDSQLERIWEQIVENSSRPVVGALTGDHGEWVETNVFDEARRKAVARMRKVTMRSKPKANWHGFHLYDYLVRVPLVVWGTSIPKKADPVEQQIRQIDLLPTLADVVGIEPPAPVTGRSVWPLSRGEAMESIPAFLEASGGPVLLQTPKWMLGVRHQGWKFAYRPKMPDQAELYDLRSDPQEQNNLVRENPEQARLMQEMIETDYIPLATQLAETDLDMSKVEKRLRDLGYL